MMLHQPFLFKYLESLHFHKFTYLDLHYSSAIGLDFASYVHCRGICVIEHTDGSTEQGIFPKTIAPYQPFLDIRSITHLENLAIRNLVRNHLSKSILDSGWDLFKQYLTFKAVNAGREIRLVNPAYTSKCCSNCGAEFQDFDLSTR